jgi:murein L,D-transpeptidase YcbB/YkuD
MFPNEFSVYLHDTSEPELFERTRRAFSSGCVRVADPVALAEFALRPLGWDRARIEAAMAGDESRYVVIPEPARPWVFILYATAAVGEDGQVRFFRDLYGHDRRLEEALERGYPSPALALYQRGVRTAHVHRPDAG